MNENLRLFSTPGFICHKGSHQRGLLDLMTIGINTRNFHFRCLSIKSQTENQAIIVRNKKKLRWSWSVRGYYAPMPVNLLLAQFNTREELQIQIKKRWPSKTSAADVNTAFLSKPWEKDVTMGEGDSIILPLPCEILTTRVPTLYLQHFWSRCLTVLGVTRTFWRLLLSNLCRKKKTKTQF